MKPVIGSVVAGMCAVGCVMAASPFEGSWCLTSPSGGAVWMRVEMNQGEPSAKVMWEIGGVEPFKRVALEGETLVLERPHDHWHMTAKGMRRDILGTDTLRATVQGDAMTVELARVLKDGTQLPVQTMRGKRQAPLPPRPDLASLRFGEPLTLFDGQSLSGWRLTNPADNNAWSARDGVLVNAPQLEEGPSPKQFGNIRTDREFEDFRLTLEVRLPKGGNSGIYLRGRYEVQVTDAYGRPPSWGGIGGVYSRIVPLENAARPAGEWQTFDIILADRHVTVRLNGRLVIDNQPLEGCTGGALSSDDTLPGPIYFQGDHTAVEYRNILLYPRVK
ncbi:MAG TPA: DUF1080 domain-containing protein [Kiritimatiellia bacterium]|nr:DUF1080 domain-containing protein [Kiritimatiellia bacterium]HRU71439.1 DUF1080 domain-containing protein [Kiritimatiellia bacterium]